MDHDKEISNNEIHSELKKLHLSVQMLANVVRRLHEEVKHVHLQHLTEHHTKRWWQFWR